MIYIWGALLPKPLAEAKGKGDFMNDEKLKEKYPNIQTEEELDEVKKYLFKRLCGITLAVIAFVCLVLDELVSFNAGMPLSTIFAIFAVFFFYSSWGHKDLVFHMKEDRNREVITKKMITDEICGDYATNKKLISLGVAGWTVFMLFIFCKNGIDYIVHNWIGFVIVMGIVWTIYIVWFVAAKIDIDNTKQSMGKNNIVILVSPVKKKFATRKKSEFYYFAFESETYGKYNQMVDESEYRTTEVEDMYYLILRKTKKTYKLMAILNPKKWELDEELKNYLVKEV